MAWIIAFLLAGLLTALDLDRVFHVPGSIAQRTRLYAWWWGFVVLNSLFATGVYFALRHTLPFDEWNPVLYAVTAGLAYLALVRSKFSTFSFQSQEVPFGLEALYNAARDAAFRRINAIARAAREGAVVELSDRSDLTELARRVRISIENDALLSPSQQADAKRWLLEILKDASLVEQEKKDSLARFVLFGGSSGESL